MIEEADCFVRQFGDINQCACIRVAVNQCICQEVSAFLRVQDMHGSEMFESRLDADYFFGNFDRVAISRIKSRDKRVGISGFNHHHTEIVAFEHLVVGFFVSKAFA